MELGETTLAKRGEGREEREENRRKSELSANENFGTRGLRLIHTCIKRFLSVYYTDRCENMDEIFLMER